MTRENLVKFLIDNKLKQIEQRNFLEKLASLFPNHGGKSRAEREIEIDRAEEKRKKYQGG